MIFLLCRFGLNLFCFRVEVGTERDEQGSKVGGFFNKVESMYREMVWQKKLRGLTFNLFNLFFTQF